MSSGVCICHFNASLISLIKFEAYPLCGRVPVAVLALASLANASTNGNNYMCIRLNNNVTVGDCYEKVTKLNIDFLKLIDI